VYCFAAVRHGFLINRRGQATRRIVARPSASIPLSDAAQLDGTRISTCAPSERGQRCAVIIQQQSQCAALPIAQRVELARLAAARLADRLEVGPPFPPPAELWALMWVLSIIARPWIGLCPVRASKISSHKTLAAPAVEAIVDRRVRAIDRRAVPPGRARAQHMDNAADDPAIIDTVRPRRPRGISGSTRAHSASLSH
jgi:hypothetical protein